MAEIKEAKRANTPKPEVVKETKPNEIDELKAQLAEMQKMFAKMQTPEKVKEERKSIGSTKIKVMSLLPYQLNLTTEPLGGGKAYSFYNYGETQKIKFSDLEDIVHNHRRNMEDGVFYICDRQAIEELELTDEYEAIFDKVGVDSIVDLKDQTSVETFLILSEDMKDSVSRRIVEKINEGVEYNLNFLAEIQRRCGMDIIGMAEESKIQ